MKDPQKTDHLKRGLAAAGLDGLLVLLPENVLYCTHYWPVTGWACAVIFPDDPPVLIYPESERDFLRACRVDDPVAYEAGGADALFQQLAAVDLAGKKIGTERDLTMAAGTHLCYEMALPGAAFFARLEATFPEATFEPATDLLYQLRRAKTDYEIEQFQFTNEMNAIGLAAAAEACKDECTEMEVATTCEKAINDAIADHQDRVMFVRALAFVMAGPNGYHACRPFNISTGRTMRRGEYCMLELNTQVNGYWSDLTRSWVVGRAPTDEQARQARVLNEAIDKAIAAIRPGVPCETADAASRAHIEAHGLGQWHTPFLGHGIGVKLHEPHPMILPGTPDLFAARDYFSVEPGLYFEEAGALRFERNVFLAPEGPRVLDEFPCAL